MGYKEQMTEEVERSNENSNDLESYDFENNEQEYVKFHPTTMVAGTFPEEDGNPIHRFWNTEYEDGRKDQGYLGLILDDPEIIEDEDDGTDGTVVLYNEDDSTPYRVFNPEDDSTEILEGVGIAHDTGQGERTYRGEIVDEIDADRIVLVVRGAASKSVARRLDVNGAQSADMSVDGTPNGGLIEYNPDPEADVRSRYARDPELKESLYGSRVGVMVANRTEVDDDWAEQVENDERNEMNYFMAFDLDEGEPITPSEGEPAGYTYLEWLYDPDGGPTLPEAEEEFVEQYVEEGYPTDEDTIIENIENNKEGLSDDPDIDTMVELIQSGS